MLWFRFFGNIYMSRGEKVSMKGQRCFISILGLCGPLFCLSSCNQAPNASLSSVSISSDPVIDDPGAEEAKFEDFSLFYAPERGGYLVGDYKGSLSSVVVPNQATGKDGITAPIVGLADYAFYNRKGITTVLLGDSVIYIGDYAFAGTDITDLRIAGSLFYIGDHAFDNSKVTFYEKEGIKYLPTWDKPYGTAFCDGKDVREKLDPSCEHILIIPGSWKVDEYAFKGLEALKSICLPSSLTDIGRGAFKNCSSLESIIIPASTQWIGVAAFDGCSQLTDYHILVSSLTDYFSLHDGREYLRGNVHLMDQDWKEITSIDIPSSVTYIDEYTFFHCYSLTSVTIPSSVTRIDYGAFLGCSSLEEITIPSSVTYISDVAFFDCSSITEITIPSSVKFINQQTFAGCSSLTSVTIPSSVTEIYNYAFGGCSSMEKIVIPSSVTKMEKDVFGGCNSLTIYCRAKSKPSGWNDKWNSRRPVVWGYEA